MCIEKCRSEIAGATRTVIECAVDAHSLASLIAPEFGDEIELPFWSRGRAHAQHLNVEAVQRAIVGVAVESAFNAVRFPSVFAEAITALEDALDVIDDAGA
ncbi:MAG: hypothetical protein K8F92_04530 [Hyphomicrobium sp.]|uniref:hypothetical protein n=1 Tax=Hyphomicrobium sp. TaxID=82 RepID=UPI001320A7A2|nr:hypothetical protein [Hyphomicrobium sp.]KAB2943630.1 MAG: hypothetical protein F9K20_02960 [Hyphomicrobium sp.]MBZ0208905.1 hypothetical protein [Hyphomicrobium sp.]